MHKVVASVVKAEVHSLLVARAVWDVIHEPPVSVQRVLIAVEKALEICIKVYSITKIATYIITRPYSYSYVRIAVDI